MLAGSLAALPGLNSSSTHLALFLLENQPLSTHLLPPPSFLVPLPYASPQLFHPHPDVPFAICHPVRQKKQRQWIGPTGMNQNSKYPPEAGSSRAGPASSGLRKEGVEQGHGSLLTADGASGYLWRLTPLCSSKMCLWPRASRWYSEKRKP